MTQLGTCFSMENMSFVLERKMNFPKVLCISEELGKNPLNMKKKKKRPRNWACQRSISPQNIFTDT